MAAGPRGTLAETMSTSTPLGAGETWTSPGLEMREYASFSVLVDTEPGDGTLWIDFSTDGENWDRSKPIIIDQTIGSGSTHTLAAASGQAADIKFYQRTGGSGGPKRIVWQAEGALREFGEPFKVYPNFDALTDVWMTASGGGGATAVAASYDLICIVNETATPQ